MEKAKTVKSARKWILIAVAGVLAAAAVVAGVFLLGGKNNAQDGEWKLYWNVNANDYRQKNSVRPKNRKTECWNLDLAVDGKKETFSCKDEQLVRRMDSMDVFGIVLDKEGYIVGAKTVEQCGGSYAAKRYYVESKNGNTVNCNTAPGMNGIKTSFEITDDTQIYNGSAGSPLTGMPCKIGDSDQVIAIKDPEGKVAYVFTIPYVQPDSIYWNVERKWDSANKTTTREPDLVGRYEFLLAYRGEQITVIAPNLDIANKMESYGAKCFGLKLDPETGYVSEVMAAKTAVHGSLFASWYHVTSLEGRYVGVTRVLSGNTGATAEAMLADKAEVYDVSGMGDYVGQPTTVRMGDLIHGVCDSRGMICTLYVVERLNTDAKVYWNIDRKWDSTAAKSTRTPDGNGYYWFEFACDGKHVKLKTNDKEIAEKIDAAAGKHFALTVEGDTIVKYAAAKTVYGGGVFGSWTDVISLDNGVLTTKKNQTGHKDDGKIFTARIAENCKVYNVSANANFVGEPTKVQVGDQITGLLNLNGELEYILVVQRYENLPVGWNMTRMWDSKKNETTRTPDKDGYYHFDIAMNGKVVDMKTKDKTIANTIDEQAARAVGLRVSDGVITRAIPAKSTLNCKGGSQSISWVRVTGIKGRTFTTIKEDTNAKDNGKTYTGTMASNCKFYNVSGAYDDHPGEETDLRVNDTVHVLTNSDKQVTIGWIISRKVNDVDIYWNRTREWDNDKEESTRTPDKDGWYEIEFAHGGGTVKLKTKDKDVVNFIDRQAGRTLALRVKDGQILAAYEYKNAAVVAGGLACSWADITSVSADGKTMSAIKTDTTPVKTYKDLKIASDCKIYNVYDSKNYGAVTTLQPGQKIQALKNGKGEVNYVFVISYAKPVQPPKETTHSCTVVEENVSWFKLSHDSQINQSGNYVLTEDLDLTDMTLEIKKDMEVLICLNGHTLKSADRMFKLYGKLTICDHEVNGAYKGKIICTNENTYGGFLYAYNSSGGKAVDPVLNIYGGNLICDAASRSQQTTDPATGKTTTTCYTGDLIYLGNTSEENGGGTAQLYIYDGTISGGSNYSGTCLVAATNNSFIGMYGGTIKNGGGNTTNGANVSISNSGMMMLGGTISGGKTTGLGGNVYVGNNGYFGIVEAYGTGTKVENGTANKGGNIYVAGNGLFEMMSGTVTGGRAVNSIAADGKVNADGNGGNIMVYGSAKTHAEALLAGGTISGGVAENIVGNVEGYYADVIIDGTSIYGGTAKSGADWKNVFINNSNLALLSGNIEGIGLYGKETDVAMGGNPVVTGTGLKIGSNVEKLIDISNHLTSGASVPIVVEGELGRDLFTGMNEADTAYITHKYDGFHWEINNTVGKLVFSSDHKHCICGDQVAGVGDHFSCEDVEWIPWSDPTALPTAAGNYYLKTDVTLSAVWRQDGTSINLCLNGHTVTGSESARVFTLQKNTLGICDCSENQTGAVISKFTGDYGRIAYLYNDSGATALNLYSGTLKYAGVETPSKFGELIRIANTAKNPAIFNMYGGTLTGGFGITAGAVSLDNNGTFNMYGGTITDCEGENGAVTTGAGRTVKLAGKVSITGGTKNLYMTGGTIDVSGLDKASTVGITMTTPGVFANTTNEALKDCFTSDNTAYEVTFADGKLSLAAPASSQHKHCVCGGVGKVGDHTTCESVEWIAWTDGTKLPTDGGNYYLDTDVTLTATANIAVGSNVNLCLNGHTVNSPATARVYTVRESLTICDCSSEQSGKIVCMASDSAANAKVTAGVIYIFNNSTTQKNAHGVTMYGGTITAADNAVIDGPLVRVGNATNSVAFFKMYGGAVTGGKATGATGSAVAVEKGDKSAFYMYGGTITGNEFKGTGTDKGAVFIADKATAVISGSAKITDNGDRNLYLTSGTVDVTGLSKEAAVGIFMATPGVFAETTNADLKDVFTSNVTGYSVSYADGKLSLTETVVPASHKDHCLCGGLGKVGDHTSCSNVTWTEWTDATKLPTEAGNYYLSTDVTLTAVWRKDGTSINLCLNGHTITGCTSNRVFTLQNNTVSICDCSAEKTGKIVSKSTANYGKIAYLYNDTGATTLNIYGGTLTFEGTKDESAFGELIRVANKKTNPAVVNLYDVTLTGGFGQVAGGVQVDNNGTLNMYGGNITDCEGANGAISTGAGRTVKLAGKVSITGGTKNLYMSGGTIDVSGLDKTSTVGIYMTQPGAFAETTNADLKDVFTSNVTNYKVAYADGKLSLVEGHSHCICGGVGAIGDHTTCESVEWTEWTDATKLPTEAGNYYLTKDVTLTAVWRKDGTSINLCLNGHTITGSTSARVFTLQNNTMSICDCSAEKTGKIVSKSTANYGKVAYLYNDTGATTLNIYGGTLTFEGTKDESAFGELIRVANKKTNPAIVNLYDGTLTGGFGQSAGGVQVDNNGTLNMYGGTITGCEAANGAVTTLSADAKIKLAGKVNITENGEKNLYVQIGTIDVSELDKESTVGISMKTPDVFAETTDEALADVFVGDDDQTMAVAEDGKLKLISGHIHCDCGDYIEDLEAHTCDRVLWTAWTDAEKLPGTTGYYYLDTDVALTEGNISIAKDQDVHLCLNGHTVTSAFRIYKLYGTLTICDHKTDDAYTGKIVVTNNADFGGLCYLYNSDGTNSALNIYGGTIESNADNRMKSDGKTVLAGDLIYAGSVRVSAGGGVATVNLFDGTLSGGNAKEGTVRGGNIALTNDSVFNMYGGTITGGVHKTNIGDITGGGNVSVGGGSKFTMYGGTVSEGQAVRGGNVYISAGATFEMQDGTVENGKTVNSAAGKADGNGGNINAYGGALTDATTTANVIISGGNILNGYAENITGNLYLFNGDLKMSGGTVSGATMGKTPANTSSRNEVFVNKSVCEVTGGTVDGYMEILNAASSMKMSGTPVIKKFTIGNNFTKLIDMTEHLAEGADVTIEVAATGTVTVDRNVFSNMNDADLTYIKVANSGYKLVQTDGNGHLEQASLMKSVLRFLASFAIAG